MRHFALLPILALASLGLAQAEDLTEEEIGQSTPLAPEPKTFEQNGAELKVTPLRFPTPLLSKSTFDGISCVQVLGTDLYVMRATGTLHAFTLPEGDGNELAPKLEFGEQGVLEVGKGHAKSFTLDGKGRLYANGPWSYQTFENGKPGEVEKGAMIFLPEAGYGFIKDNDRLVPFVGGKASERVINASGFRSSNVAAWINGQVAATMENDGSRFVRVFDRSGNPKFDFGNKEKAIADDGFCFIHDIDAIPNLIVVTDSNCRRLSCWSPDGTLVTKVESRDLGLDYPWMPTLAFDAGGTAFLGAQEKREGKGEVKVYESLVLRIEGMDQLSSPK